MDLAAGKVARSNFIRAGVPSTRSPQLVLSLGFEAVASRTAKTNGITTETKAMMGQVKNVNIAEDSLEEAQVTPAIIRHNKVVFIHTPHEHSDIIQHPDNFKLFIENSPFLKK